jgi:membrane peptidoglycan carboxypeptidase
VQFGTATAAQSIGRPAAGKTGTTLSSRSAWFAGFTPQLATAVGLYRPGPDGEELTMKDLPDGVGTINGGTYPAQVWAAYMKVALEGTDIVPFPSAANINPGANPPAPKPTASSTSASPTPTPTRSRTATPTPSASVTPSPTPTPTPTPTPSPTTSGSPSPTVSP